MRVLKCDRCGKEIKDEETYTKMVLQTFLESTAKKYPVEYDLCEKCLSILDDAIQIKKEGL
jgi:uncharacterized C2H2 Zn-finger protein